jgi:hypothetical protein
MYIAGTIRRSPDSGQKCNRGIVPRMTIKILQRWLRESTRQSRIALCAAILLVTLAFSNSTHCEHSHFDNHYCSPTTAVSISATGNYGHGARYPAIFVE